MGLPLSCGAKSGRRSCAGLQQACAQSAVRKARQQSGTKLLMQRLEALFLPPVSAGLFFVSRFLMCSWLNSISRRTRASCSLRRLGAMRAAEPAALPNGRDRIIYGDP